MANHYLGSLRAATGDGFKKLLVDMNTAAREGYRVVHVAALGDQIGVLFEYQGPEQETRELLSKRAKVYDNFFE